MINSFFQVYIRKKFIKLKKSSTSYNHPYMYKHENVLTYNHTWLNYVHIYTFKSIYVNKTSMPINNMFHKITVLNFQPKSSYRIWHVIYLIRKLAKYRYDIFQINLNIIYA